MIDAIERAQEAGQPDDAFAMCGELLRSNPSDIRAKAVQGIVLAKKGRFSEAIPLLDAALRQDSTAVDALIWLSVSFRNEGSLKAAAGVALRANQVRPHDARVLNNLGLCQKEMLLLPEGTQSFRRATELSPEWAEAWQNLGAIYYMQGLHDQAANSYEVAVRLEPENAWALVGLSRTMLAQARFEEAFRAAEKAVDLQPDLAAARILLAQQLIQASRAEEACRHAEAAVELAPKDSLAYAVLGSASQSLGLLDKASASYLKSIELEPKQGSSYHGLIFSRKVTEADRMLIPTMETLTRDPSLPQTDIRGIHYALGKAYEGFKEYKKAMLNYDEANRIARFIKFRNEPFDRNRYVAGRDRVRQFFTPARFEQLQGFGLDSDLPILIVGMMRSGTTLMEQILSRHPQIGAAGEQLFWTARGAATYDESTETLDKDKVQELAREYLTLLQSIAPGFPRVTDKLPANVFSLGFVRVALPNARIIHMNRNAADVCFSNYVTPNEGRADFLHSKANIAFAYESQQELVEYWRQVLPADRLMDVVYEELVEDQEKVTRSVLEFLGLEWSDLCLSPEDNARAVATPSVWQVRQPVYKTSVERWKNFEQWVPEFARLVQSDGSG